MDCLVLASVSQGIPVFHGELHVPTRNPWPRHAPVQQTLRLLGRQEPALGRETHAWTRKSMCPAWKSPFPRGIPRFCMPNPIFARRNPFLHAKTPFLHAKTHFCMPKTRFHMVLLVFPRKPLILQGFIGFGKEIQR